MTNDQKAIHQGQINLLADAMFQQFEEMKQGSNIIEGMEEDEDNDETNNAIKELYPDLNLTINDILSSEDAYQLYKPPSTSENL